MVKRSGGELLFAISIDRASQRSVTSQVYNAVKQLIVSGDLAAGKRLPSSRTFAAELKISRTTAIAVFERLVSEGLVVSRTGSGSFVSEAAEARRPNARLVVDAERPATTKLADLIAEASPKFFQRLTHPAKPRAFITGLPDYDAFPLAVWSRLSAKHWSEARDTVMGYSDPDGLPSLRQAIAGHLRGSRGIACEAGQIFIVNGAQQAFDLIGRVLLNRGDRVWFENPGAIGARNSFIACGAAMAPVPVDAEGLSVEAGLRLAPDFRLAFVTPAHQHPTGAEMSLERRAHLLSVANERDAWIVEDDYDGEFRYDGRPLPTLKSADQAERVIYVGTFSKAMFPSLRLGFYVAPQPLVPVFRRISGAFLHGVPSSIQAVTAAFITEGHFATHLRRMRDIYRERHEVFHDEAGKRLGGLLDVARSAAGFHVVGRFVDPRHQEDAVEEGAAKAGLTVSTLGRFCIEPIAEKGLVLGVSAIAPRAIRKGVEDLARVLENTRGSSPATVPAPMTTKSNRSIP
ncbi:PLP-dependent aminotransferase family protein [Mesorhizobium sp. LHD-90]|uniref:MocR-like pyridoxine biosynthesis transcription factor PdxR n=1 Tax=Mesorhizobium sp. LHD-90 TaxID=3071414 RepID=UPI0027E16D2B|nr:PLP-dependent aminotransferase family protein [Mesorhizobium sp. LHD-90]MDQ6433854.1 PLP-dependent aminotransferase family protein [Mesorhizobium sp. LHD-90]